jgi:hypothetical protein
MNRRILFADQSIEIGEAESTAAPMRLLLSRQIYALSFSQQNAVTTALSSFNHWNLDENQKNVLFAECVRSAVLSADSRFDVSHL